MGDLAVQLAVAVVDVLQQLLQVHNVKNMNKQPLLWLEVKYLLVFLEFLLKFLEGWSTIAGGGLRGRALLDVSAQVQEVLLARLGAIVKWLRFAKTLPLVG